MSIADAIRGKEVQWIRRQRLDNVAILHDVTL